MVIAIVQAFDQHLQEAFVGRCIGVVITHLAEGHVHGGVFRTHLEFFVLHNFGDLGGFPVDHRHLHCARGHLFVTDDRGHGLGHGGVAVHRHGARTGHGRVGIQRDVATGLDLNQSIGSAQIALAADGDAAANQRISRNSGFQTGTAPGHVHARIEVDVAVGAHKATGNGQALADVEQNAAVVSPFASDAGCHDTVDRGHRCQQMHQFVGQDERIIGGDWGDRVAARHLQAAAGLQKHS